MQMRIVEAGNHGAPVEINEARRVVRMTHHDFTRSCFDDLAIGNGECIRERTLVVLRGYLAVEEYGIGARGRA